MALLSEPLIESENASSTLRSWLGGGALAKRACANAEIVPPGKRARQAPYSAGSSLACTDFQNASSVALASRGPDGPPPGDVGAGEVGDPPGDSSVVPSGWKRSRKARTGRAI